MDSWEGKSYEQFFKKGNGHEFCCPVSYAMSILGGKWKLILLWHLIQEGTIRYWELKRTLGKVTDKMLIQSLRELESDGMVIRSVEATVPPKVSYSLTEHGKGVEPIIRHLHAFGMKCETSET